jgi:predicted metal-dependent HD superfamily phosphohydrolase
VLAEGNLFNSLCNRMFDNWQHLLELFGIEQIVAEKTYMQIVEAYSTPSRYYDTLAHIAILQGIKGKREREKD